MVSYVESTSKVAIVFCAGEAHFTTYHGVSIDEDHRAERHGYGAFRTCTGSLPYPRVAGKIDDVRHSRYPGFKSFRASGGN